MSDPLERNIAHVGDPNYPEAIKARDWWVCWILDEVGRKRPVAPWKEGHAFPTKWNSELPEEEKPHTQFKTAHRWADFDLSTTDVGIPENAQSETLSLGILLPNDRPPLSERISLIDWDDVRDPETGEIHPVAAQYIKQYGGYVEVSTSGNGLHQFVRGGLRKRGKFIAPIDDEIFVGDDLPQVEIYDGGRHVAMTGKHVVGTDDCVIENQSYIDSVVSEYAHAEQDAGHRRYDPAEGTYTGTTTGGQAGGDAVPDPTTGEYTGPPLAALKHRQPDDYSLAYHAAVETFYRGGGDAGGHAHIQNWRLEGFIAALGQSDGLDKSRIKADLSGRYLDDTDVEQQCVHETPHRIDYGYGRTEAGRLEPPTNETLIDYGVLPPEAGTDSPSLDAAQTDTDTDTEAEEATDGGVDDVIPVEADTPPTNDTTPDAEVSTERSFDARVNDAILAFDEDEITRATARDRIAKAFTECYDFVFPEEGVRGWRTTLYVYHEPSGVHEPRGERFVERELEQAAGDFVTNQAVNEIVGKIERRSIERGDDFSAPPQKIVVDNGILDLHTGECIDHTPDQYHRTCIDVAWNPDAGEPDAIDDFLHDVVADSDVPTLYRLIAHTLYKEYIAEKAAILIGSGKNGKSVFIEFVEAFIGSGNVSHRELQDFDDDGFAANNLQGKLANLATEIGEQELNNTTVFKKLTGRDTMDAQVKYESPVTFENHATMMFSTNNMPVFGQDNFAIWRRWVYLDFPYTFKHGDKSARDPEDKSKILDRITAPDQLEALLLKCQQEIQRWHENRDEEFFADAMDPADVREKMKKAAEPVYNFASACLSAGDQEETFVPKSTVRSAYRKYADIEDLPTVRENVFGERLLTLRDFQIEPERKRIDGERVQVYVGVELSARGRQVLGLDAPADDDDQSQVDAEPISNTALVMAELREMVDDADGSTVKRNALEWRAAKEVDGQIPASNAIDKLAERGEVVTRDGDIYPIE